jgi:hypothetical protein
VRAAVFVLVGFVVAACGGPQTLRGTMDNAERSAQEAENALDEAEKRMDALDAEGAASSLDDAQEKLSDPNISKYPEHGMLKERLAENRKRLDSVKKEIAKRELEKAVQGARQLLEAASARLTAAIEAMKKPSASRAQVEEVEDAEKDLADRIGDARDVETKDAELGAYADGLRKQLAKSRDEVGKVSKVMAFRSGPGNARVEASVLVAEMKGTKDEEDRAELRSKAIDRFQVCVVDGKEMLVRAPELARTKIELDGRGVEAVEAVVASCQKELDALVKKASKPKKAKSKPKKPKKKR